MRGVVRVDWLLLLLLGAAGCTQDFSAFRFQEKPNEHANEPSTQPRDSGAPGSMADVGPMATADGGGTPAHDASTGGSPARGDAAVSSRADAAGPASSDAGSSGPPDPPPGKTDAMLPPAMDASTPIDAGLGGPDGSADAGEAELLMCVAAIPSLQIGTELCHQCACDWCATQILDCLTRGSEVERKLCGDVLRCSLQYQCQDYTCYCRTPGCNVPEPVGNGPCATIVNRAAGGTRTRVDALRNADPLDPNEPLIRAGQAIACIYGVNGSSPGPEVQGMCNAACQ